jgi:hypothetical protein
VNQGAGFAFFSCTTLCHTNRADMDDKHSGESLYHFDPNAQHSPASPPWPTGHVGCVKSGCHADGRH